tara:strand:- start:1929 stop:2093 length:165 start_codon:yes stop_codon:yes gene_type:complete
MKHKTKVIEVILPKKIYFREDELNFLKLPRNTMGLNYTASRLAKKSDVKSKTKN